ARPGDERDPPGEVGGLVALLVVEVAAGGAELVVEGVEAPELGLADVALARGAELGRVARGERWLALRGEGRGFEDGGAAGGGDAGLVEERLVGGLCTEVLAPPERLGEPALLGAVGDRDPARGGEEPEARLAGHGGERGAVGGDGLEHLQAGV